MQGSVRHRKRWLRKLGSVRHILSLCPRGLLVRVVLVFLLAICLAGIATSQVIGPGTVRTLRKMSIKVVVRDMLTITALKKFHLVR
jgi:hypothetical protein